MGLTKLDTYNYTILPGVIRIYVHGTNDPDLVDIMSELERNKGKIYVEGCRYLYLNNYRLISQNKESYIELDVVEVL